MILNHTCGALDVCHVVVVALLPQFHEKVVGEVEVDWRQLGENVLSVHVEGAGNWLAQLLGHVHGNFLERERLLNMYYVCPFYCLTYRLPLYASIAESVGVDYRLEDWEVESFETELRLRTVRVGVLAGKEPHVFSSCAKGSCGVAGRCTYTVSGNRNIVADV